MKQRGRSGVREGIRKDLGVVFEGGGMRVMWAACLGGKEGR